MNKEYPSIVVTECVYCPLLKINNKKGYCTHYKKSAIDITIIQSFCVLYCGGVICQDNKPTIKSKFPNPYF